MNGGVKKGKSINLSGWKDLIVDTSEFPEKPEGYSTAYEIAKRINVNLSTLSEKLKRLRETGKIECMQVKGCRGKIIWAYKD